MFFHIVVFMYIYSTYGTYYTKSLWQAPLQNAILILILYVVLFDTSAIYGIEFQELAWITLLSSIFFMTLMYSE